MRGASETPRLVGWKQRDENKKPAPFFYAFLLNVYSFIENEYIFIRRTAFQPPRSVFLLYHTPAILSSIFCSSKCTNFFPKMNNE